MRKLLFIGLAFSLLLIATTARGVMAQNVTTNASNAVGNMSASANKTGTEMAANMSNTMGNASKSASRECAEPRGDRRSNRDAIASD